MQELTKRDQTVFRRLIAALAVGSAIASTAYFCAYYELKWAFWQYSSEGYAWSVVWRGRAEIEDFRKAKGHLPADLKELREGEWNDMWNRPLHYEVEGDSYKLYSYGRDGEPGGEGLDADMYANTRPKPPTLHQFTFDYETKGIQATCFLAGVCAGIIRLLQKRKRGWGVFLMRLGATAIGAVIAAMVIGILHIPTGH
jgi:hypothetical protein